MLTAEEGQSLLDAADNLRTSLLTTADEEAVDAALADDDLIDGAKVDSGPKTKPGRKENVGRIRSS